MALVGLDLFAGAGGMSLGAVAAGIRVALAVEADHRAAKTYSLNHPATPIFADDIRALRASDLRAFRPGVETIVFGGSPCQGFSTSNQRTRNAQNPSNWLYLEFVRIIRIVQPTLIVFENVQGFKDTEGGRFFLDLLNRLSDLGYSLMSGILNASDFGVPQNRKRIFVVGHRNGSALRLPSPGFGRVTVSEAISDLPSLDNGASTNWLTYREPARSRYAKKMRGRLRQSPNHLVTKSALFVLERYRHIPQGHNWTKIPPELMANYRNLSNLDLHTGLYHRLRADQPSTVIGNFRKNMLIHPEEDRGLSVREAARIQSFPDSYEFSGSIGFQQQQVGNAVPPLLAKAVFDSLLEASRAVD